MPFYHFDPLPKKISLLFRQSSFRWLEFLKQCLSDLLSEDLFLTRKQFCREPHQTVWCLFALPLKMSPDDACFAADICLVDSSALTIKSPVECLGLTTKVCQ